MKPKLRIAINAQILPGIGAGGVETVLRGLTGLGRLDGDEEYIFIGHWADSDWLKPFMNERQKLISGPLPKRSKFNIPSSFKRSLGSLRPIVGKAKDLFIPSPKPQIEMPVSEGFYEALGCDVIHFPYQKYVICKTPTIYNPHDLQHLHYPEFFSKEEIQSREVIYPWACRAAQTVTVASQFVKQDIVNNYGIDSNKIQVIPWAAPERNLGKILAKDMSPLSKKYEISDEPFVLYPAMTWEHKNHIRLLEAVAWLRDYDNLKVNLICTGHKNEFFPKIKHRLQKLKLENQVKFLGVVSHEELEELYMRAQFVIIPTLFEAASAPLFEAWKHDVAVACSAVTSLPEQAADAALLFDPFSVQEIADSIKKMGSDRQLRTMLRVRGSARLKDFSLERTLKSYRAVYRKVAGLKLNDEDLNLLN